MYNYDRMGGGGGYDDDHKKHVGLALILTVFSVAWMIAYGHYLQYVNINNYDNSTDCCVYTLSDSSMTWDLCGSVPTFVSEINVTWEFRMICAVGVGIYTVGLAVALGHMCKPFRCFTKIFGVLIWVAIFGFFIACNVFRFRE